MRHYRLTLSLKSGELHELELSARSRNSAETFAIAAIEAYQANSATLEFIDSPHNSCLQVHMPAWLH